MLKFFLHIVQIQCVGNGEWKNSFARETTTHFKVHILTRVQVSRDLPYPEQVPRLFCISGSSQHWSSTRSRHSRIKTSCSCTTGSC